MLTFVASIFVFGILIFFHELGHFAVAKFVGIKVHEFSLGFGPKLLTLPKGDTSYNLRILPLGGFVRMAGMDKKG
jgi:regulator of sigma E protease